MERIDKIQRGGVGGGLRVAILTIIPIIGTGQIEKCKTEQFEMQSKLIASGWFSFSF